MQRIRLECFGTAEAETDQVVVTPAEIEEHRLAGFEEGYQAGWDDAGAARDTDEAKTRAVIHQNLQDLSFTYHEARHHLLTQIEPLMMEVVRQVLPRLARQGLANELVGVIHEHAAQMAQVPLRVRAQQSVLDQVRDLLADTNGIPVTYEAPPDAAPDCAYVAFAGGETKVDLGTLVSRIDAAVTEYFNLKQKDDHDE